MNKESIESIWYGRPIVSYASDEDEKLMRDERKKLEAYYLALENKYGAEVRGVFQEYVKCKATIDGLERKNTFVDGFCLAMKLALESFSD